VWRLEPFYGVGMASQDQLNFSLQATGDFWGEVRAHAQAQGRVYFLLTKIIDLWLAARPEHWRTMLVNIAAYALSPLCFAYAVCRAPAQRWLYLWLFAGFAWLGYAHLPPSAYPTINHVPFALWALAALLVRRQSARGGGRRWLPAVFAPLTYLALFQYEPVAGMSLCVLAWIIYADASEPLRRPLAYAGLAGVCAYAATYAAWRLRFPTSYDGAMVGALSLWDVLRVTIAYGIGALPYCETYRESQPLRFGDQQVRELLLAFDLPSPSLPSLLGLLLTLVGALGALHLYRSAKPAANVGRAAPWARPLLVLGLFFAINAPLGLSVKYRQWVRDLDETYLTSQLAFYVWVLGATWGLDAARRWVRIRGVPLVFALSTLTLAVLAIPVRGHNVSLAARQRAGLARWEAMTAFAAYADRLPERELVAPDLYYSVFVGERNWGRYWRRYVRQRFGGDFHFRARPARDEQDYARLRLYRFEDGSLRALTVQSAGAVAIIARPANLPPLLVSSAGTALSLDGRHAEPLGRSGYSCLTLREPASILGADQEIEPIWLLPHEAITRQY
jgi:hypothetical protein